MGFQNKEILVSADGAVLADGTDFPASVDNGATFVGFPQADLQNSIETAGDLSKIKVDIAIVGTQFGVKPPSVPMPRTIKLINDGIKCPAPKRIGINFLSLFFFKYFWLDIYFLILFVNIGRENVQISINTYLKLKKFISDKYNNLFKYQLIVF